MQTPIVIAVIDDEPAVVALAEEVLGDEGYATIGWPTGTGAAAFVRKHMPNVVLLDMRMETPHAGMEVLRVLRDDAQTRTIPVILASSRMDFGPEQEAELHTLAVSRLPKPFSPAALVGAVTTALSAREATGAA